jgi:hypothetical protein
MAGCAYLASELSVMRRWNENCEKNYNHSEKYAPHCHFVRHKPSWIMLGLKSKFPCFQLLDVAYINKVKLSL